MSLITKIQIALSVVFILAVGAVSVTAQSQFVTDSPSSKDATSAASTRTPKAEVAKPLTTAVDNLAPDRTSEADKIASEPADLPVLPTPAPAPSGQWQFQFTPYAWIAGSSGDITIGNRTAHVSSSITDSSVHINFAFMGALEARKNKIGILTDLEYSNLGTNKATPGPGFSAVKTATKTFILDPEVGYVFGENKDKGRFVEVLGGFRYWHITEQLNFTAGTLPAQQASASRDWADAVVGLRGKAALNKKWFVTGKMDLGGGGSHFTYQLFGGVGVMVAKKVALIGGFRDLYVNRNKPDFSYKMSLHGPIFGLGFKF